MAQQDQTTIDLARLGLRSGEGARRDIGLALAPIELGGQEYAPRPAQVAARLDISRTSGGHAFRLRFPLTVEGPCVRCLGPAGPTVEVDAREVDQGETEDEELRSPYVVDERLDIARWAHDAAVLALPDKVLCRAECAGLCPVCGEPLNDAEPGAHEHETGGDPRWSKLRELQSE